MTRARYRFREHAFSPDERPEAPPVRFVMQCVACGLFSPRTEDAEDGSTWAFTHLMENAGHLDYIAHATRPYRFEPGAWQ
ncbi:hypothetical protein [Streptomyces hainanensis]|uniref:DUF7848 domain-containing protein n=1 Tax=Streptomyces hainanensis TaxID=402648 RepID=A0A4R4T9X2_9ACTN|nr:hypothetical protein [Streptomyces hainanensis]TDC73917.1 hypothetical protein E1283_17670 [Streptomyces hainanensis]